MFTVNNLVQPTSIDEAYKILTEKKSNTILGGCCYLRMGSKRIDTAVELSKLNLNYIRENNGYIEIGAYTTFRDLETSIILQENFNGVIPKAVKDIIGVQFRSIVTVGASVFSKYGFSDLIPVLLSLDCQIDLYKGGRISLFDFLNKPYEKDILTKIYLKKAPTKAVYINFRNAKSDYSIINVAVSKFDDEFKIIIGSRPLVAKIALKASEFISNSKFTVEDIETAGKLASEELSFGSNMRASAEYRKALSSILVKRALGEVIQWK